MSDEKRPVIHLVLCPNADFFHGDKGKGEVYINYLFIPDYYLYLLIGKDEETVDKVRLVYKKGVCTILEDVEEMVLIKLIQDNSLAEIKEPDIWRTCIHCKMKGIRS